jgi:transcriptional regulator with XRE-family HTH domain
MNRKIIEKIKRFRIAKGLKQAEMAEKLNITRAAYQKIESGKSYSWAKYLDELMNTFDTTPRDFFQDIGNQVSQQNNNEGSIGYAVGHSCQKNREVCEKLILSCEKLILSCEKVIQSKDE